MQSSSTRSQWFVICWLPTKQTNLQNDNLKRTARLRKQNSSKSAAKRSASGGEGPKYTDRAAARREAYGQPDAPNADKHEAKKARYEPAPTPIQPPAQPDKDGIQATNVGSKVSHIYSTYVGQFEWV